MTNKQNDDFFIKNAILCFLHHYPEHKWAAIYEELAQRDSYTHKPQPRRAKRAPRKANTDAPESGTEGVRVQNND